MSHSQVLHRSFYSPSLGREKRYCIYLPPGHQTRQDTRYAVLYMLPGLMDYERTWIDKGRVHEHMDQLLAEGRVKEMIVVMPDKDQAATSEDEGEAQAFESYLARDVIAHIDGSYRTLAARHQRGIEGLSLGAGWAAHMGLNHPDLFSSVGSLSGGFGEESFDAVLRHEGFFRREGMRFRVGVGTGEQEIIENNQNFVRFMRSRGFYCEFDLAEGAHDWPLWQRQVHNSLQFHSYSFYHRG